MAARNRRQTGKVKNCQLFISEVNEIDLCHKNAKNGRTSNEKQEIALLKTGLCTPEKQKALLTTKVHLSEATLFID